MIGGRDLIDDGRAEVSAEVLHRMIRYVRAEARRLQVMDVALLLEHAEDAVAAFSAPAPRRQGRAPIGLEACRVEH